MIRELLIAAAFPVLHLTAFVVIGLLMRTDRNPKGGA